MLKINGNLSAAFSYWVHLAIGILLQPDNCLVIDAYPWSIFIYARFDYYIYTMKSNLIWYAIEHLSTIWRFYSCFFSTFHDHIHLAASDEKKKLCMCAGAQNTHLIKRQVKGEIKTFGIYYKLFYIIVKLFTIYNVHNSYLLSFDFFFHMSSQGTVTIIHMEYI